MRELGGKGGERWLCHRRYPPLRTAAALGRYVAGLAGKERDYLGPTERRLPSEVISQVNELLKLTGGEAKASCCKVSRSLVNDSLTGDFAGMVGRPLCFEYSGSFAGNDTSQAVRVVIRTIITTGCSAVFQPPAAVRSSIARSCTAAPHSGGARLAVAKDRPVHSTVGCSVTGPKGIT